MKPLEFLAEVLPPPGNGSYCVVELSSRKKEHAFVTSLSETRPYIRNWLEKSREIYFALATFDSPSEGRTAQNASRIQSIFIDMDGYASKKEAAVSLAKFLEKTGLDSFGNPYIVASGGGLHGYWPLTEPALITEWKPIAESFKRLCKQEGLRIDMTVTADAARVLRIPGTMNFKKLPNGDWKYGEPKPVKVLIEGAGRIDLRSFGAAVLGKLREENAPVSSTFADAKISLSGAPPRKADARKSALTEALLNSSGTRFQTIWLKSEQSTGCGQLEFYINNAQQDGMEPIWRGLLSWAKVCDDGDEYARKLSELHPYPLERMHQKLADIKGPYACIKMDEQNPGVCPKCPYWGRITNALALGREFKTDNRAKFYDIPINAIDVQHTTDNDVSDIPEDEFTKGVDEEATPSNVRTHRGMRPTPPKGFDYADGGFGGVLKRVREKDSSGTVIDTQIMVLPYDLFVLDMLRMDEKEHHAHLMAVRHIGGPDERKQVEYTPIILPSRSVVAQDELVKCLASHNIYAAHGKAMDQHLAAYVRSCVEEAALMRKAVEVPIQYGWQRNKSFVYNNRVFMPDGSEVAVPMPGLENLNRATNSRGTLENWRKPWRLLQQQGMHHMLALCLDSFGASLMHFAEYEGFTWHIGSTESGTGKSLTLSLKAGVWGHPIRYRTSKGTSQVAMQQRAGLLNSLPLLIDEITSKARNDIEWAPGFIFDMAEGQGKERMESGSNRERINNSTWATTCTMTSNVHMLDVMTGARKHSSHGEMMRMLEWNPSKALSFNASDRAILKELRRNYGVAGEAWVRWLVQNYDVAKSVWVKTHERMRTLLNFADDERYWHAGCTAIMASAVLLGEKYSNVLPDLPMEALSNALKELVNHARDAQQRSVRDADDILNSYTREFYGKFVVIRADRSSDFMTEIGKDLLGNTSTRNTVLGRIEHGLTGANFVDYYIEEHLMKQHCAAMSYGYADFKRQMLAKMEARGGKDFSIKFGIKKDMLARTDGPAMRVNVLHLRIHKDLLDETLPALASDNAG